MHWKNGGALCDTRRGRCRKLITASQYVGRESPPPSLGPTNHGGRLLGGGEVPREKKLCAAYFCKKKGTGRRGTREEGWKENKKAGEYKKEGTDFIKVCREREVCGIRRDNGLCRLYKVSGGPPRIERMPAVESRGLARDLQSSRSSPSTATRKQDSHTTP